MAPWRVAVALLLGLPGLPALAESGAHGEARAYPDGSIRIHDARLADALAAPPSPRPDAPPAIAGPSMDGTPDHAGRPDAATPFFRPRGDAPEPDSMIVAGPYGDRGWGELYANAGRTVAVRPFAPEPAGDGAEADGRTVGGVALFRPLAGSSTLSVQAAAVSGPQAAAEASDRFDLLREAWTAEPDTAAGEGTAGSLTVSGTLFHRRLHLDGEVAASDFDLDAGGPRPARRAGAFRLGGGWTSDPDGAGPGEGAAWGLEASHERRGRFFASLGGPGAPADLERTQLSAHLAWRGLRTELSLDRRIENPDHADDAPSARVRGAGAGAGVVWSPGARGDWSAGGLLGRPTLRVAGTLHQRSRFAATAGGDAAGLDHALEVATRFAYPRWSWEIGRRLIHAPSFTSAGSRRTEISRLALGVPVGGLVRLSPHLRHRFESGPGTGAWRDRLEAGFGASLSIAPARLDWTLNYDYEATATDGNASPTVGHSVGTSLSWLVAPPVGGGPSVSLALTGTYNRDGASGPGIVRNSYEMLGSLTVGLRD